MPIIGVTGGVATGKSSFSRALAECVEAEVFDADFEVRALLEQDRRVRDEVKRHFGSGVFGSDGRPDRGRIREIVFADSEKRRILEEILHPAIRQAWASRAEEVAREIPTLYYIVDIPLLYETKAEDVFDRVVVVACSAETQMKRLLEIRNLSRETAGGIIASQWDLSEKVKAADHVVWNDGGKQQLRAQAERLAAHWQTIYG